jgi:hypothetical protein
VASGIVQPVTSVLNADPTSAGHLTESGLGTPQLRSGSGAFYNELQTLSSGTRNMVFSGVTLNPVDSGLPVTFDISGTFTIVPEPATLSSFWGWQGSLP